MKLENPPKINFATLDSVEMGLALYNGKYKDFLQKATNKYWYWSELKYQRNLPYDDAKKAWKLLKLYRTANFKHIQFGLDKFSYFLTTDIQKKLHDFDLSLMGGLYKNPISEIDKKQYLQKSLLEEAIASSQMEGAATTTKVAVKMLKSEREPRNESEQMIFNNLRTINFILSQADKDLTIDLIIELHEIMTVKTSAESCAGSFRKKAIFVKDTITGETIHTAPYFEELEYLMSDFCDFANAEEPFVHPIVKASILHFMIGYIHPFEDGNGRTARALFYWFLIKKGYVLMKNISISKAILKTRRQYDKAFLKTEKDNNDLTYFIIYSIKTLNTAFENLLKYRDKKKNEAEQQQLMAYKLEQKGLNKRQASLIAYLYAKKDAEMNLTSFAEKHDVVRQTARRDINELKKIALIKEEKDGRNVYFSIVSKEKVEHYLY